jgi:hypothetical protein
MRRKRMRTAKSAAVAANVTLLFAVLLMGLSSRREGLDVMSRPWVVR